MNLMDVVNRKISPEPWAEGEKIPWHDASFSSRMLHEHLSQEHNAASRRVEIIDQHVDWIHSAVLNGKATKILDLGCGPGLYTSRLARLGHICEGIDFAPASVEYARQHAEESNLACSYIQEDVREASFGTGYGLVMMINGELNVFRPEETRAILEKARKAMKRGGQLVVEVHKLEAVRAIGEKESNWTANTSGLFSDEPHLLLYEAYWYAERLVATERYYVVDVERGEVMAHAASIQGYGDEAYVRLLENCRFSQVQKHALLGGEDGVKDKSYVVYTAEVT